MIVYSDIDNTICRTKGSDYENAIPIRKKIKKMNKHFENGDIVIYWTSRGGTSGKDWFIFTLKQLIEWGCKFHSLRLDKPSFDIFYEDKAKKL